MMVKEINLHEIQEGKCIPRDEKNKEPSQGKEKTGTDLIRCMKQSSKEPEQNLTANGVAKAPLEAQRHLCSWSRTAVSDTGMHQHSCHAPSATSFHMPSTAQVGKLSSMAVYVLRWVWVWNTELNKCFSHPCSTELQLFSRLCQEKAFSLFLCSSHPFAGIVPGWGYAFSLVQIHLAASHGGVGSSSINSTCLLVPSLSALV